MEIHSHHYKTGIMGENLRMGLVVDCNNRFQEFGNLAPSWLLRSAVRSSLVLGMPRDNLYLSRMAFGTRRARFSREHCMIVRRAKTNVDKVLGCGVWSPYRWQGGQTTAGARLERTLTRVLWIRYGEQRLQRRYVQVLNSYMLDISTKARLNVSIY